MDVKFDKKRSFYFHFNKPETIRQGSPKISVHIDNTCYILDKLIIEVETTSKFSKRQPRFVMKGKAKNFNYNQKKGEMHIS